MTLRVERPVFPMELVAFHCDTTEYQAMAGQPLCNSVLMAHLLQLLRRKDVRLSADVVALKREERTIFFVNSFFMVLVLVRYLKEQEIKYFANNLIDLKRGEK